MQGDEASNRDPDPASRSAIGDECELAQQRRGARCLLIRVCVLGGVAGRQTGETAGALL